MGNKGGKPRPASEAAEPAAAVRDEDAPPPLFAADAAGLGDAAISLRRCGVACVRVDDAAAALHRACFEVAKDGMDSCEEMVRDGVAELRVGVVRDPAHGFVLTIAAGGVLTELMRDSVSVLVPASRGAVRAGLEGLRIAPLLAGYRGGPGVDMGALLDAVAAVQAYVLANADTLDEVEINPLICTPSRAVAVDALIRKGEP